EIIKLKSKIPKASAAVATINNGNETNKDSPVAVTTPAADLSTIMKVPSLLSEPAISEDKQQNEFDTTVKTEEKGEAKSSDDNDNGNDNDNDDTKENKKSQTWNNRGSGISKLHASALSNKSVNIPSPIEEAPNGLNLETTTPVPMTMEDDEAEIDIDVATDLELDPDSDPETSSLAKHANATNTVNTGNEERKLSSIVTSPRKDTLQVQIPKNSTKINQAPLESPNSHLKKSRTLPNQYDGSTISIFLLRFSFVK
ncbi:hypothetical protein RFI_13835, partial [Reticulomyxa filosa]